MICSNLWSKDHIHCIHEEMVGNIFRELRKTGSHPGLNRGPLTLHVLWLSVLYHLSYGYQVIANLHNSQYHSVCAVKIPPHVCVHSVCNMVYTVQYIYKVCQYNSSPYGILEYMYTLYMSAQVYVCDPPEAVCTWVYSVLYCTLASLSY